VSGLSAARLDEVVDVVTASLDVMFETLIKALEEGGHRAQGDDGHLSCSVCREEWPCSASDKVLGVFRSANNAMRAVGCDEEVFAFTGQRHKPRAAS